MEHEGWIDARDATFPSRYVDDAADLWRFLEGDCLGWEWWDEAAGKWQGRRVGVIGRVFRIPPDFDDLH